MMKKSFRWMTGAVLLAVATLATPGWCQEEGHALSLAGGKVKMTAPSAWEVKKPAFNIIDYEFSVPPAEEDDKASRVTVMQASGSVEQNIARWKTQLQSPAGQEPKVEKKEIAGQTVHLVDLAGDYRPPFRPSAGGKDYRMLGAIIRSDKYGQFFVRLTGPEKTVEANKKGFNEMIESLKVQ